MIYDPKTSLDDVRAQLSAVSNAVSQMTSALQRSLSGHDEYVDTSKLVALTNQVHRLRAVEAVLVRFNAHEERLAEEGLSGAALAAQRYRHLLHLATESHKDDDRSGRTGDTARSFNDGVRETVQDLRVYVDVRSDEAL